MSIPEDSLSLDQPPIADSPESTPQESPDHAENPPQAEQSNILKLEAEKAAKQRADDERLLAEMGRRYIAEQQKQPDEQQVDPLDPNNYPLGEFDPKYQRAVARAEAFALLQEQQKHQEFFTRQAAIAADAEKFATEHADYGEVTAVLVGNPEINNSKAIYQTIQEAENPAALAYYLGKHPEEALKISRAPYAKGLRMLGAIEGRLAADSSAVKSEQSVSSAPEPIKPVRGTGSGAEVSGDPAKATSMAEYVRRREAQLKRA